MQEALLAALAGFTQGVGALTAGHVLMLAIGGALLVEPPRLRPHAGRLPILHSGRQSRRDP